MTFTEIQTKAQELLDLWRAVLPEIAEPPPIQSFALWLASYGEAATRRGIFRTARKWQMVQGRMSPEDCARYCAGVSRNEFESNEHHKEKEMADWR
jgi:hypothetical protein